jgi:hypothetical protein
MNREDHASSHFATDVNGTPHATHWSWMIECCYQQADSFCSLMPGSRYFGGEIVSPWLWSSHMDVVTVLQAMGPAKANEAAYQE